MQKCDFLTFWDPKSQRGGPGSIFPFFFEMMGSDLEPWGGHFWDISGDDLQHWFTSTSELHFHQNRTHLTPPLALLFWRISETHIPRFSTYLSHQSLGFRMWSCSFLSLFHTICSLWNKVNPCLESPTFLTPFWDPEGAPFPSGSAPFSWVVFGTQCTGIAPYIYPSAPDHGYI